MPPVLVTGAPGWLGTRLVQLLSSGLPDLPGQEPPFTDRVRCLCLPGSDDHPLRAPGIEAEVVRGDLRNPEDATRFCAGAAGTTLFHCAGIIHPKRIRDFYDINLQGSKNLLEAAERAGVRRAVIMSSNSPIGVNPAPGHTFDEDSPYHPYMNYGRSKMLLEQEVARIAARGKIETVVIRSPWFYGPLQPERQSLFFRMIRDGKAPLVGDGSNRRSMAYIDNICQGMIRAARVPAAAGRTYWIADRRPYSMNEIYDTIETLLEREFAIPVAHRRMRLPFLAGEIATVADRWLQGLGIYQQKVHVLSEMNKTIACRVDRAERELGYVPTVDLTEGMRRSIAWVLETYGKL
ncbi:MAG TPA: NAD(P)-dependent oxidoreductase [Candidatus Aminicenantes bacterium]|nr:NAD(P)-dependent oxidoreductase [Candidatus Aminicenantes bacterium]